MDNIQYATPEAEIAALRRIVQELNDDLEDSRVRMVELEMDVEQVHSEYERKLQEQINLNKALSTEATSFKIKGDFERQANDRLQKENNILQKQFDELKVSSDKQKRCIAELEIELEKSFNNERVLRDRIQELEESEGCAMEKVADMETRLIEMEQRARDADYFPIPAHPINVIPNGTEVSTPVAVNGEIVNTKSLQKIITKKKESRNSVQVIDDLIGIIEKFEKLLFKEEDHRK